MSKKTYTIAIDFDDTLTNKSEYPITGSISSDGALFASNLASKGYRLILWSSRNLICFREAVRLLKQENLYSLFDWKYLYNPLNHGVTGKLIADFYVDDRCMLLSDDGIDFNAIYHYILKKFPVD